MPALEELFAAVFVAQGTEPERARRLAAGAVLTVQLAGGDGLVQQVEQDAHLWELRGVIGPGVLPARTGVPRATVYRSIRRHTILRAAIKRIA